MSEPFYKLKKADLELVKSGKITVEEMGFRDCLALSVNPANGFCVTNFSVLAADLNEKPAKVKYIFDKLKELGLVYFEMRQGKRDKSYFFVMGLEMSKTDGKIRIVTPEYIEKISDFSEVKTHFQKLKSLKYIGEPQEINSQDSEVPYMERKIKIEKEMEKQVPFPTLSKTLFRNINREEMELLEASYDHHWLETRLKSYSERLQKSPISFDRLKTMLDEDWAKNKPSKDYRRENEEERIKRLRWAEEQKADEGKPIPEGLKEWREKSRARD